jgi:hypothetical protein
MLVSKWKIVEEFNKRETEESWKEKANWQQKETFVMRRSVHYSVNVKKGEKSMSKSRIDVPRENDDLHISQIPHSILEITTQANSKHYIIEMDQNDEKWRKT